jgi:hypothetical protein
VPLYGYVVEDMDFTWIKGLEGFFGWSPREDYYLGFNPRHRTWTGEFDSFKAANPNGRRFEIEPAGISDLEELISVCKRNGIQLIFVYSPEYTGMQQLTSNRAEIFARFHELASRYDIPMWDYSDWQHDDDQSFFYNSQHLNATGAAVFSMDLAQRLREYFATRTATSDSVSARNSADRSAEHLRSADSRSLSGARVDRP